MAKPSKEILETLAFKIQDEGLDYCFNFYSDWKEITDPNFRLLVKAYKDARESLETFLNDTWGIDKILEEDYDADFNDFCNDEDIDLGLYDEDIDDEDY